MSLQKPVTASTQLLCGFLTLPQRRASDDVGSGSPNVERSSYPRDQIHISAAFSSTPIFVFWELPSHPTHTPAVLLDRLFAPRTQ
ncbi:uncharacterized protein CLUP02_13595 [Colletotrichum lupini]|uniref:Uncharacterized protein n=1 Tax=Colletotrichum lupini TaxID=145971 RepID=A0A9Q8WLK7_9PEZI|nr:uncharacterized protein CLUP02_13595 [Colletotrichum lupini]UQC88073.1 hypothetical protein CLUP02_13595 [Colletotrichum lupini]